MLFILDLFEVYRLVINLPQWGPFLALRLLSLFDLTIVLIFLAVIWIHSTLPLNRKRFILALFSYSGRFLSILVISRVVDLWLLKNWNFLWPLAITTVMNVFIGTRNMWRLCMLFFLNAWRPISSQALRFLHIFFQPCNQSVLLFICKFYGSDLLFPTCLERLDLGFVMLLCFSFLHISLFSLP